MSTTAIALAADYAKFHELVEISDDLTPEMIADTLEGIEGALGDKLDAAFIHVRNIEGQADTLAAEIKRLTDRKSHSRTAQSRSASMCWRACWPAVRAPLKPSQILSRRAKAPPAWWSTMPTCCLMNW